MNGATTSGICNIMTGLTTSGTVNICTGTGATQTGKVNIGTGTTTGAVTIGNSANTVTFQAPQTLTYNPSLITSNMQGYIQTGTGATASIPTTTATTIRTLSNLGIGVWLITGGMGCVTPTTGPAGFNYFTICISSSSTFDNNYQNAVQNSLATPNIPVLQVVRIVSNTSAQTWNLIAAAGGATNLINIKFEAVRIA